MSVTGSPRGAVGLSPVGSVERIVFIRTDRLGEAVLNLPVLAVLHQAYPGAHIAWLVNPELIELFRGCEGVDELITYREHPRWPWWWRAVGLARSLRREHFGLAVVSNPKREFHLAAWLAGIPMRVGYRRKWGWLLTHALPDRKAIGERHEVEYNLDLVRALGIEVPPNPPFRLPIDTRAERAVEQLLEPLRIGHDERLVALHPWTSNPRKQWPGEWFGRLAERLIGLGRVRVLLLGGASERALGRGTPGLRQVAVVDLVGRLSLPQTAALLRRVRVLVSNDSGPVHVAAAVGTPTVVLFGGSSPATGPQRWGPWGPGHTVLCKPALDQISLQEVLDAVGPYL